MRGGLLFVAGCALLAGCTGTGAGNSGLASFPGVQAQIESFYDAHATEDDWNCEAPQMDTIDRVKEVGSSAAQVTLAVNYYFQSSDLQGLQADQCKGFNTRFFTFDKGAGGRLGLVSMSGQQRGQDG